MAPTISFLQLAAAVQFSEPKTELEKVLKQYAWANSGQVIDIVVDNWRTLKEAALLELAFIDAWTTQKWGTPHWTMSFSP